jgi:SPP1 family predicted phage head-tail adaptor
MQAGKLDKRVRLERQSEVQDEAGQPLEKWILVAPVWAEIKDISGREFLAAQASQSAVQTKIRIRYREGISASMRAVHGSTVYNIEAALDKTGKRVELELMCSTGLNNG